MDKHELMNVARLPLAELIVRADRVRRECAGGGIELCSIMNAKSGACSEDCAFCAQSARHATGASVYRLKSEDEMFEAAARARELGADRFDVVTSGDHLTSDDLQSIARAFERIRRELGIKLCASLGTLDGEAFALLKAAGLTRYHHNIETSRSFFPRIVSTHTFDERVRTIRAAKEAGLEVCSGGIIGLGETMEDRIDMALTLRELGVDSVPLNVLVPIAGTRLEGQPPVSGEEVIRTIALFRIVLRGKIIKVAAGRESALKDYQALAFLAGANGMLIGGYLTIRGRDVADDHRLVEGVKRLWKT